MVGRPGVPHSSLSSAYDPHRGVLDGVIHGLGCLRKLATESESGKPPSLPERGSERGCFDLMRYACDLPGACLTLSRGFLFAIARGKM